MEELTNALRENLSPRGIALIAAYLQPGLSHAGGGAAGLAAGRELEWFYEHLVGMLGTDEYNALAEEVGV